MLRVGQQRLDADDVRLDGRSEIALEELHRFPARFESRADVGCDAHQGHDTRPEVAAQVGEWVRCDDADLQPVPGVGDAGIFVDRDEVALGGVGCQCQGIARPGAFVIVVKAADLDQDRGAGEGCLLYTSDAADE